jgi:hypothetical protein
MRSRGPPAGLGFDRTGTFAPGYHGAPREEALLERTEGRAPE